MPSREQIQAWAEAGESETVEFKSTTGQRRPAVKTLCGMLNANGGRVLFGVLPNGEVCGQQVGDRTIEELANDIREIEPSVTSGIDRVPIAGAREVLIVWVPRGPTRPYSHRGQAYRRVGNTTVEMSRDEYNQMLLERLHADQRWENQAADGWSVDDLDIAEVTRTLDEAIRRGRLSDPGTREPRHLLRGMGLIVNDRMLLAAPVLFGQDELVAMRLPQCLLRVAKFRGVDKAEFIDNRQFHGNLFQLLTRAERFLREHVPVAGRVIPGLFERADDPLYPPVALREALANAVCHRDYSIGGGSVSLAIFDDRLEITSSGPLHFGLTPEALFHDHDSLPWNPIIADVFYKRGIVERWGRGTQLMADLARRAGLPRPEIEETGGCVSVRFRPDRYVPPERVQTDLSEPQRLVLAELDAQGRMALRDLRAALPQRPEWAVKEDLAILKNLGLIDTRGHGRGAYWYRTE